jgi:hypothetical protein
MYSEQQELNVVGSLWVGIPDDSVVFANVMVSEVPQSDNPEIKYDGGVSQMCGCTIPAFVKCKAVVLCCWCIAVVHAW